MHFGKYSYEYGSESFWGLFSDKDKVNEGVKIQIVIPFIEFFIVCRIIYHLFNESIIHWTEAISLRDIFSI